MPPDIWLNAAREIVGRIALPQLILAVLALTSYHVQIINRISSGYPVWYWWLATMIVDRHEVQILGRKWNTAKVGLKWMVLHATIQGGLFRHFCLQPELGMYEYAESSKSRRYAGGGRTADSINVS
jgi:hypothetical protein